MLFNTFTASDKTVGHRSVRETSVPWWPRVATGGQRRIRTRLRQFTVQAISRSRLRDGVIARREIGGGDTDSLHTGLDHPIHPFYVSDHLAP